MPLDTPLNRRNLLAGSAALPALAQDGAKPNIIYIHSHDTGRYLQPYGYPVPAPAFQKLAEQGVLFRQAFSAAPTCSPSRASLLTGCCAHVNGMLGLAHRGFSLKEPKQHIVHTLRAGGYKSALIGVQHVSRQPATIGYDEIVPVKTTKAEFVGPAAVQWLKNAPKQPFFVDIGFQETHREYPPPGPAEDPRYSIPPHPIPDTPDTRMDMARYKACARILDDAVGGILRALDEAGLTGNTLIISTTDHGVAFPAMKCNLTDHGIGVSLIMRGPGGFTGGKVVDAMVSHLDLYPTICDMAGVAHPAWLEGTSLLPLIRGEKTEIRDQVVAEVNYHASYEPKRAVRTRRWKYIRNFNHRGRPVLPNCDDGLSKDVWLKHGWKDKIVDEEQLYDLVFDPNERHNLAGEPRAKATLEEMRGRMAKWMQSTNDPALHGDVAAPSGAVVNDADGISPKEKTKPAD